MLRILCYGYPNTWGYNPYTSKRYELFKTWPYILKKCLQKKLKEQDTEVIVEGLNGRTSAIDDAVWANRNGMTFLPICLESHAPISIIIIMLGTNDMKARFNLSADQITGNLSGLIEMCRNSESKIYGKAPEVLIIAPPTIGKEDFYGANEFKEGINKSKELPEKYALLASNYNCYFLNSANLIKVNSTDGIHFEEINHEKLGKAIAKYLLSNHLTAGL